MVDRPIVWSRRNGPWRQVSTLWVGAAPGNAGGRGAGCLGAHATRIPFGGDIAGANLEVLLAAAGLTRNDTFIVAALNQLPEKGGGEPTRAEILAPAGDYTNSLALLADTILACGPRLIVALGNVAARCTVAAMRPANPPGLPGVDALRRTGIARDRLASFASPNAPGAAFGAAWQGRWTEAPLPQLLWTTHPSAQNMSPYARQSTLFHSRMLETRDVVRAAATEVLGTIGPRGHRPALPDDGIYALPEWRDLIAPRHAEMDRLWREKGV
ncbi:MAG: uracil-DNA glycosylase family protein [Longimicrobiales bacterium]